MKLAHNNNDEVLIDRLRQSDPHAFKLIYNNYAKELYRYARRVVIRNEDCEEIIQDVFESLWRRRHNANINSLRAYLYKAVSFKIADYHKQKAVHHRYVEHFKIFEAVYDSVENKAEVDKIIEEGIKMLPGRLRDILRLKLDENLSNHEIAKRMKLTHGTVDTYMHQVYEYFRGRYSAFVKAKI